MLSDYDKIIRNIELKKVVTLRLISDDEKFKIKFGNSLIKC